MTSSTNLVANIWSWVEENARTQPDEITHAAKIAVWGRWIYLLGCGFMLAYRPAIELYSHTALAAIVIFFAALNLGLHSRLILGKAITWRWMLAASAIEVALITTVIVIGGGFKHFFFVAYYPSLALIAVAFTSIVMWVMWTTLVAVVYTLTCIMAGPGLDLEIREEKYLFGRILTMYAVVSIVNLISRIERIRRRAAVKSARMLVEERTSVSRTIHDTSAQAAYMVSLGIEQAMHLADRSNEKLMSTLEATSELAKSAMWELRGPVNMAGVFEGKKIGEVLRSHISTFTAISSVPAEFVQSGDEPDLGVESRMAVFAIAHNALTNAFRHSDAENVTVALDFEPELIRLRVSDDGVGLPEDFEGLGHGMANMRADAERVGGRLVVESGRGDSGTTVVCELPQSRGSKED